MTILAATDAEADITVRRGGCEPRARLGGGRHGLVSDLLDDIAGAQARGLGPRPGLDREDQGALAGLELEAAAQLVVEVAELESQPRQGRMERAVFGVR